MEEQDKSYNRLTDKYRFNRIHKPTKIKETVFWDKDMASTLFNVKFPEQSKYYFEVYPYRFYWLRCLLWNIQSIILGKTKIKNIAIKPRISILLIVKLIGIILGIIVSVITIIEFIKYL